MPSGRNGPQSPISEKRRIRAAALRTRVCRDRARRRSVPEPSAPGPAGDDRCGGGARRALLPVCGTPGPRCGGGITVTSEVPCAGRARTARAPGVDRRRRSRPAPAAVTAMPARGNNAQPAVAGCAWMRPSPRLETAFGRSPGQRWGTRADPAPLGGGMGNGLRKLSRPSARHGARPGGFSRCAGPPIHATTPRRGIRGFGVRAAWMVAPESARPGCAPGGQVPLAPSPVVRTPPGRFAPRPRKAAADCCPGGFSRSRRGSRCRRRRVPRSGGRARRRLSRCRRDR